MINWKFWQKKTAEPQPPKSKVREWGDALLFAVIAATLIRTFLVEAYTIPTSSMEKSLMIGDFLFVSKISYGARIPMTPIAFPFAHHTMPIIGTKAYSEVIKLGYHRLPGLGHIERNDVVVFNYPMEYKEPFSRPVDKRENYIKRCVGIPGDSLQLINSVLFVNNAPAYKAAQGQMEYLVTTNGTDINPEIMMDMDVTEGGLMGSAMYQFLMTAENAEKVKALNNVKTVTANVRAPGQIAEVLFPYNTKYFPWNIDNYGKIYIPKKGSTVKLDSISIELYRTIIEVYEGNKLEERAGKFFINGAEVTTYTFKMDYFWMMGDNRHNSADSRFWGFVPEDHIVGKAWMIWLSYNENGSGLFEKIRWNRIFSLIH